TDDEQAIDDVARRLEMATQVELAEASQTVRPAPVLGAALFEVARRWCEILRPRREEKHVRLISVADGRPRMRHDEQRRRCGRRHTHPHPAAAAPEHGADN